MSAFWSDLIKVPTRTEIVDKFIGLLRLAGFPVASWHSGSFQKHTVETESSLFSDLFSLIQTTAKAGFIRYAGDVADEWADLCASDVFLETRKPAVSTQGKWKLVDAESIGPITIQPGSFWVANADKSLRYVNIDPAPVNLPLGGSVELTIQAEGPGAKYNVGVGALTEILTPQPGLIGSNDALDTGTWITQQGADKEATADLVLRCLAKWATLGSGANDGAYFYHASVSSAEISRIRVYSPYGGSVRVVVAGSTGPVSSAALASAAALIETKRPTGVPDVQVLNATVFTQPIVATITIPANTDPAAAVVAAQAAVDSLARSLKIGARVSRERVIWALMNTAIEELELVSPAADVQLGDNEIWVPSYSITVA